MRDATSPRPATIALIGCGRVVERYHLPALLRRGDAVAVAAVVEPGAARRAWAAAALPGVPVLAEVGELLARHPTDAVLIATPPATHAALARACLEAGRHVLVEKPLAPGAAEAEAVVAAARAAGRVLAVGFNRRFRAPYRRLRRLVGEAGGVRLVAAELVTHAGRWDVAPGLDAMLADVGCHLLDLVPWLAGQPLRAVAVRSRPAGGGEEVADFSIELGDGSTVACRAGYGRRAREGVVTAATTGGRHRLVHAFGALPVDLRSPLRYPLALAQEVASTALRRATRRPGLTVESVGLQLDAFTGSIGGAATTGLASARDGLRAAAPVDALLASAATAGARVELAAADEE